MNERKIGIVISYVNIFLHALVGFLYVPLSEVAGMAYIS